jgi:hypothetical protein
VQPAQFNVKALADHLIVTHEDRSNERIGADPPAPAIGKLERPAQMPSIRACERGVHATD